jgi:hemerythrin-like domain-containing protein
MNWAKYADKKGKTADFKSKERELQPAQEEVKDSKGKVVQEKKEAVKESYIALVQKRWDAESGEALPDLERQYSLSELEREKERYDAECARAKEYSDGLKAAIADFKKL